VATAQFGEGIDIRTQLKLLFPIGFRGEVRDYLDVGDTQLSVFPFNARQHNVVPSGGCPFLGKPSAKRPTNEDGKTDAPSPRRRRAPASGQKPRG